MSERRSERAFTILEVMIALTIFFTCVFAILGLVSRGLNQARNLQPLQVDAITAFAELSLTNRLEEGPLPPEIVMTFEAMHPGYTVQGNITQILTNGMFQVDFVVGGMTASKGVVVLEQPVFLFRPLSPPSASFGGGLIRR